MAEQAASNRSALGHEMYFAGHRARLTQEILERAPASGEGRLCLLGAGNANDVELETLAGRFREVHLVDIDDEALARARARLPAAARDRVILRAPFDLSGLFDRLEGWAATAPEASVVSAAIDPAVRRILGGLSGPFDLVVSACLLTQLQLILLQVVGDRHPRFDDLRMAINRIHVQALAGLIGAEGVGLLVTDLTSSRTYPLDELPPDTDLGALMGHLVAIGNHIYAAHPGLLSAEVRRDPQMRAAFQTRPPIGPWLWRNGPTDVYLVYALEIRRSPEAPR